MTSKNSFESNDSKVQLNLRVTNKTKKKLEQMAKKNNLIFNRKGSISDLLDKLGEGDLSIDLINQDNFTNGDHEYHVSFQILVADYPGSLSKVANIFKENNIQIIGIETTTFPPLGFLDLVAVFSKEQNLDPNQIKQDCLGISIEDIWEDYAKDYIESKFENDREKIEKIKSLRPVSDVKCSICIRVVAEARPGLLADITYEIAKHKVNIISVFRLTNNSLESISNYHLEWSETDTMQSLISSIEKVDAIKKVQYTSVDTVLEHFEKISHRYRYVSNDSQSKNNE